MSISDTTQLEQYLFSENKEDFIKKLISGTDTYYYFSLITAMNNYGLNLPNEHLEHLKAFRKFRSPRAKNIKLRYLFLQLAAPEKNETQKKSLLMKINKNTLNLSFAFDEPKAVTSTTIMTSKQELSNKLDPNLLNWKKDLEACYTNLSSFNSLDYKILTHLDLKKMATARNFDVIYSFLNQAGLAEFQDLEDLIKEFLKLEKTKGSKEYLHQQLFKKMSLEQLRKLNETIPDLQKNMGFVGEWFIKEFEIHSADGEESMDNLEEKNRRKEKLQKMYAWSQNLPFKFHSFSEQILFEMLHLGVEANDFDFDLFVEYLKNPKNEYSRANSKQSQLFKAKRINYEPFWHQIHSCKTSSWLNDDSLIDLYLEAYFKLNKKISPFDEFLDKDYLNKQLHRVKLYEGEQIPNITDIFPAKELKALQDERMISLCKFNKEFFTAKEEVTLYVEIKNVSNMTIKIFEISAEDFYLKRSGTEISATINVDGLIASEELNLEFSEPPQRKIIKEFKFENITKKKQGVFIIEFIGFGLSSRALIRKGKLLLLEKSTLAGLVFTILDEELEICKKKQRTGLWVQNRFHEANENGQVNLPFSSKTETIQAIVVHEDFACLTKVNLVQESYEFKCSYLFKDESLLMGNKMKLLIQPRLYLNGEPVSLSIIKKPSVSIVTITDTDIPSTVVLSNITFDHKQELEISVPIPARLKSLELKVSGKIKKMIQEEKDLELNNNYVILVDSHVNEDNFCGLYLRYSENGYEVYLLGKNGEPKPNIVLAVKLTNKYIKSNIQAQLQTDADGKVILGELNDITKVEARIREKGDIKTRNYEWTIGSKNKVSYPQILNICEGDVVNLPYFGKELNKNKITFLRILDNEGSQTVISNRLADLKLAKNSLAIEGLRSGTYALVLKEENQVMKIQVNQGKYWKNTNLMVMKDYLLDVKKALPVIVIENLELKSLKTPDLPKGSDQLSFTVFSDEPKTTRIHIFAYQFLNVDVNCYCDELDNNIEEKAPQIIPNVVSRNQYLSNKTLGDEYCYVLNRKKESRYVGNTLEKPPILLKRTYVRDTVLEREEVAAGTGFKEKNVFAHKEGSRVEQLGKVSQCLARDTAHIKKNRQNNLRIDNFLNFLRFPALIVANVKPDENGKVVIKDLDLSMYATLEIVATNLNIVVHEVVPLRRTEIQRRDLRQGNPDNKANKFFSIFRNAVNVSEGAKLKIDDLTSTELQMVDSLEKIFNLQKELRKSIGTSTNQNGKEYDEWKFITKWNTMSIDEKQRKYDEFSSHELNLFLYFKDRAYFEEYIKPFLLNKLEKTFVDFFLLDEREDLLKYNTPLKITSLNSLEKILLIITLIKHKLHSDAEAIAIDLENQNKIVFYDTKTFKKLFDTILGSKSIESETKDIINELRAPPPPPSLGLPNNQDPFSNMNNMNMNMNFPIQQQSYPAQPPQMMMMQQAYLPPPPPPGMGGPPGPPNMLGMNPFGVVQPQQMGGMGMGLGMGGMGGMGGFGYGAPMGAGGFGGNLPMGPYLGGENMMTNAVLFGSSNVNNNNNNYGNVRPQQQDGYFGQSSDPYEGDYHEQRAKFIEEYKSLGKTKEYEERNYYRINNQVAINIKNSTFWVELAKHLVEKGLETPFLSSKFYYCTGCHTEMLAVLAFIGLPFEYGSHNYQNIQGKGFEIQAASNSIIFLKEIREGKADLKNDLLIAQRFYDPKDRYLISEEDPSVRFEKDVDEYVVDKIYGCEVIVTNVSVTRQEFQVLYEIPEGSLPIRQNEYTKSTTMTVNSFTTQTLNFFFYFPKNGNFKIYPANISRNGIVLAISKEKTFEVHNERISKQLETIDQILAQGSKEDILEFVKSKNLHNKEIFNFSNIYYLLKDKKFYSSFMEILKKRKIYDYITWSFSLMHGDMETAKEFLNSNEVAQHLNMKNFTNEIVSIKKVRLLEYYPLMNARVHQLSLDKSNILNKELKFQYQAFLEYLVEVPKPSSEDWLSFVYYLLLQDRIDDAIKIFSRVDVKSLEKTKETCRLQYDYFLGYLDFYSGYPNFKLAREICEKYLDYPVLKWRNLFYEMANQLAEYDGEDLIDDTEVMKNKKLTEKQKNLKSAEKEETLTAELHKDEISIIYQNCSELILNYYLIDLEVLFSRNPFLLQVN